MSLRRPVLLAIDIPTHVRVLAQVARLLEASGRYEPVILFKSEAVRDYSVRNFDGLRSFRHEVWTGSAFVPFGSGSQGAAASIAGPPCGTGERGEAASGQDRIYLAAPIWKLPKKTYKALRRRLPWLPSPLSIVLAGLAAGRQLRRVQDQIDRLRFWLADAVERKSLVSSPAQERERFLAACASIWNESPGSPAPYRTVATLGRAVAAALREQRSYLQAFAAVFDRVRPALLVLPEENLFYGHLLMGSVARDRGVATCIVPFTIVNTLEWAEAFHGERAFRAGRIGNGAYAEAFPQWTLVHRRRKLILPPAYILSSEYLGVAPDHPWLINSGPAQALAVESGFMADYYRRAGVRAGKLRRTGALSDDELHGSIVRRESARADLFRELGLTPPGKLVLLGLPPDQFPAGRREGCEYARYEDLIRGMVQDAMQASGPGDLVVLNLHPRIEEQRVAFCEELGARIVRAPIEHLVPLADLYVAVASATIRLAMSCGIPVINYDAYVYRYDDYDGLPGVLQVQSRADYRAALRSMLQDEGAYARVQESQRRSAAEICPVDGQAGARLLALFDALCRPD